MSFGAKAARKATQKADAAQKARDADLRVERARELNKDFSEQTAFRRRLRGIFSLLSNGFKGFSGLGGSG